MNSKGFLLLSVLLVYITTGCGTDLQPQLTDPVTTTVLPTASPLGHIEGGSTSKLTDAEIATLQSLQRLDPYTLHTMKYYADYETYSWFTDFGPGNGSQLERDWGCSIFAAMADPKNMLFGRNFDWGYSPALLLFTYPEDGYASISMVNLSFLGYRPDNVQNLAEQSLEDLEPLLSSPRWPLDGVNQMGLAVGIAAVPGGNPKPDPLKRTVGSLGVVRELLDHAADVEDALKIFNQYNIDFSGGPPIHYLVSDSSGNAVVVEYYQDEMVIIPNQDPFHMATNFLLSTVGDEPLGHCNRYDIINQTLTSSQGTLDSQDAMALLEKVSQESTQWSIVYNNTQNEVWIAMGLDYSEPLIIPLEFDDR